ncbi:MAG: hypothetical protein JSW52_08785 [Candidatus Coatesbacteria bacterium]|nr:MAG: hypothetical protein JSW52_08785 [Candidatus Coatesbacteria bacterium]
MPKPILLVSILASLFAFTACEDGGTTPLPPPSLDLTEPAKTLEAVEQAFNEKDLDDLALCIADTFTFHFDEDDIGGGPGDFIIPETWGKEEFLKAVGYMFADAYSIDMDIDTSNVGDPEEGATEFTAENVLIELLVMVDATNGFLARGFCDFGFAKDTSGGYDNWRITDWWDYISDGPSSIGSILAWFYGKHGE